MLDEDEVAILEAAAKHKGVLRRDDDQERTPSAFDRVCEKVLTLGRRGLLKLPSANVLIPTEPGSLGKHAEAQLGTLTPAGERELASHTPPDEAALAATRRVIRAHLRRSNAEFGRLILSKTEGVSSASSAFLVILHRITQDELRQRSKVVLDTWSELLSSQGKFLTPVVMRLIRQDLVEGLDAADALWGRFFSPGRIGRMPTREDFKKLTDPVQEELDAALDMASATGRLQSTTNRSATASIVSHDNSIHIHGSVTGAVMSGHGSTATMTVGLNAESLTRLVAELAKTRDLVVAGNVSEQHREEVVGVLDAAIAEAQTPTPNRLSLFGLVAAAGGAIQTLGSTPEAYKVLKAAATLVGIHLP